jgi:plastocyanin
LRDGGLLVQARIPRPRNDREPDFKSDNVGSRLSAQTIDTSKEAMVKGLFSTASIVAVVLVFGIGSAWAEAKITVSREESKPQKVEVKAGEEVRWINATGGTAHVEFAGANGIRFYIGKEGRVKFDKPGTYDYTVHVSGVKAHAHTGTVLVK